MANLRVDAEMPTAITLIGALPNGRTQKIGIGVTITETALVYSDFCGRPR